MGCLPSTVVPTLYRYTILYTSEGHCIICITFSNLKIIKLKME